MLRRFFVLLLAFICFVPFAVHAAGADLRLNSADIRFSKPLPLIVGDTVRIYTKVQNIGTIDVTGYVTFYQGSDVIAEPQVISVVAGSNPEEAFVDFIVPNGTFNIRTVVSGTKPADVNLDNNVAITATFTPISDNDHDGIQNASDNCLSVSNPDQLDTDHDGIGNACDDDIDGDGLSNAVESEIGSSAYLIDTDGDGIDDAHDAYPLDPKRWVLEKPKPVVKEKPVTQTKLVTNPVVEQKSVITSPVPVSKSEKTENNIIQNEIVPPKGDLAEGTKMFTSSNAVFTYEKRSWNVFEFRLIAPVQEDSVYEWDFGDGVRSSKTMTTHTYAQAGSYQVVLKTMGQNGEEKSESADIHVTLFSFSNPWIIGLMTLLGLILFGTSIAWFKMKKSKRLPTTASNTPLKQIHVKEE